MKAKTNGKLASALLRAAVVAAAVLTASALLATVGFILYKGVPHLSPDLFALHYTTENCSVVPSLINTVTVTLLSLLLAVPLGVLAAVYLAEYSRRGGRLVAAVRAASDTLAGIPSIVYGLFGYMLFVIKLGFGYSLLAGSLTLAVMILPTIIGTAEEAMRAVPDVYREGSFGLGAGRLRTVFRLVLPSAVPGIAAGVVLATGRIIGETAALIYTSGTFADSGGAITDSGRTLSVHMYALWNEGLAQDKACAVAVVLLVLSGGINALAALIAKKLTK